MQSKNVSFTNQDGEALAGILDVPAGNPIAYALFAHCFTCSKNLKAATNIARSLTEAGIAVLRFDFTGLGQSEGDFADTSFSSNVEDLKAAAMWLEAKHAAPSLMVGHSLGGTAVLQAAPDLPAVTAVATIGSPAAPSHLAHMFKDAEAALREQGEAEVNLGGRPFRVKEQFLDDLERHDLPGAVAQLRKALLVMHAPLDSVVEVDNASALFVAAKHPKSFISLDSADHLLSKEEDSRYAGAVLAQWAKRYLPAHDDAVDDDLTAAAGEVVAQTYQDSFRTEVKAGAHSLIADEPTSVGGTDSGPTPYDLLSAALAACTTMTLKMYAAHKKIELESATVSVKHGKVHAEDCADCESSSGKVDEFQRVLTLKGDLTEAQQQRMLEIADRCPVHKTLHTETKVRTSLAG